ncbi:MAG: STAS domain-containing protein [Gaiellales bacterium]
MPSARPSTVVFAVAGPLARADLPSVSGGVAALLETSGAEIALCDVGALDADAVALDALARMQLAAGRMGRQVVLRHVTDELRGLMALVGLDGVLRIEPGRQAEQREQRVGVEEERELGDPPA